MRYLAVSILFFPIIVAAQEPVTAPQSGLLLVTILDDNAILNIRERVSRESIVQVEDENHRPVAGALVSFSAPGRGPSAIFGDGKGLTTLVTDDQGRVVLRGIRPNSVAGQYRIRVNASQGGRIGSAEMHFTNMLPPPPPIAPGLSAKALVVIVAGAVAATGAGLAVGLTRNPQSPPDGGAPGGPPRGTLTLQPGGAFVGPPPR